MRAPDLEDRLSPPWRRAVVARRLRAAGISQPNRSATSASLAFKLALLAVAPFVVLSTVLLLGVTYQFERLAEKTIGNQEMEFSAPVVKEIDAAIRNAHEALDKAANRISTLPSFDEASLRRALEGEDQLLLLFSEGLQVEDANHRVVASIGAVRQKQNDHTGYSFPAPSSHYIVSLPFEALSARAHPAVAQSVPIAADGQIRGHLSGASDLFGPRYLGPYRNTRFGTLGYFSLTTPNRILFLHKDPRRILHYGGPPGLNRAIDRGLQGWEGWMNTTTAAGPMITAIRKVPSTGWILSVHYPKKVAQAPFLTARRDLVLAVSLGAAALLAVVLFLSRRMLRPLLDMKRQVEALTEGTSDVTLLPIHSGDEIGVLSKAFNRLVQERTLAEKELRASEERFRLAFRTSPEAMAMTRVHDHVLVAVNEGFEQLFEVNEADAVGHTLVELGIHIDGTDALPPNTGGTPRDSALRVITPRGRRLDLSVSSSVVNVRGVPHRLTMSRDVTALRAAEAERERLTQELRASEERHRRVVRNVPVVQWAWDNEGVFTLAEGLGLLSLDQRSEPMVGSNIFERYADNAQILEYFVQASEGHLVSGPFQQGAAAFDSHWGPLRDESGAIVGVTAIALDVTERQRAELGRRESESRMALLERLAATGRLAAGVAHEINNPLTYVISSLEDIQSHIARVEGLEHLRHCADEAMDGASRVAAIVRDLRAFSGRPQRGQPRCQPLKVVDSAAGLMRNQIRHRARLEVDCHSTPEAAIESGRLTQVLVNLLMNACQAVPEGNVEGHFIRLSVRHEQPWIIVQVSDSGEGIEPDVLPHLFEPFFTTRTVGEGTGLGLSISFAIVTEVGGSIEVQSPPGEGATFLVRLPVAEEVPPSISEPAPARVSETRRLRLLVIDDEPLVGRAVARHLRGHDVTIELRGQAALDRLRAGEQFDAILTDLMMPDMSGIQFYEQLRRELPVPSGKIIFMSGGAFGPEAQAFMARENPMVYEKPLDLPLLSAYLRRLAEEGRAAPSQRRSYVAAPTDPRDRLDPGATPPPPSFAPQGK
jgi:PAS domain S-box-containing protein